MGIIIAGFSGVGKTTLAAKYKNVYDLDASEYVYDDSDILHIPFEQRKGSKRKSNSNWPENYISAIEKYKQEYSILLVWDREDIIGKYIDNNIEFKLCYPSRNELKNYISRFKNRGNTNEYIDWKLKQYEDKIKYFENLSVEKIVLLNNETFEDYLLKNGYKLEL